MVKNCFLAAALLLLLCGCDKVDFKGFVVPTGDVVNSRFEQSSEMHSGKAVATVDVAESYTFYVCTDPHVSKEGKNIKSFATLLRGDDAASFGVVLGDCIDRRGSMPVYRDAIAFDAEEQQCDKPIFSTIGNHDLYFSGWDDFKKLIGPSVYWFEVAFPGGKDIYISLDTATGTLGDKQNKWFRSFLEANRKNYRHCVIMTHTNFFYTDNSQVTSGNMPLEESFALIDFLGKQEVSLVLQGHDHYREDLTYDNVRYTVLGAINDHMANPEYLKVYVNQDDIRLDWRSISSR